LVQTVQFIRIILDFFKIVTGNTIKNPTTDTDDNLYMKNVIHSNNRETMVHVATLNLFSDYFTS